MNELAPIVLFVYNRPDHTKKTVEALKNNAEAKDSILYIYSDAAKKEDDKESVQSVRNYIRSLAHFKNVIIVERERNYGLAENIIEGVSKVVNEYGAVIVLEDDIVTSPYFLNFMNSALKELKDEKKVWHISGWNYPIDTSKLPDIFLWRGMNCWGWATWKDCWNHFEKNTNKLIKEFTPEMINKLNLDGAYNFWDQVLSNQSGRIDTWAIYWFATIFKNGGLCLNPAESYVKNIGFDGSGTNSGKTILNQKLNSTNEIDFNRLSLSENQNALIQIQQFYKKRSGIIYKVKNKLKTLLK